MCTSTPPHGPAPDPLSACSYHNWFPLFRRHALRSVVVELPPEFLSYLTEDGVYLEESSDALPLRSQPHIYDVDDEDAYKDWSDEEVRNSDGEETGQRQRSHSSASTSDSGSSSSHVRVPWTERFPELQQRISAGILELGGNVVPKLNWSCPSDAAWVNPSTNIACSNSGQVVLMLKSSDRIAHDLDLLQQQQQQQPSTSAVEQQQQEPVASNDTGQLQLQAAAPAPIPAVLVLRKWYDLRPEREFRCFVRSRALVGACQRDISQCFPQLVAGGASGALRAIKHAIAGFHSAHVANHFPLENYAYDLYVATDLTVKVLDFNVIGSTTSPLLFTWEELGYEVSSSSASSQHVAAGGGAAAAGSESVTEAAAAEPPALAGLVHASSSHAGDVGGHGQEARSATAPAGPVQTGASGAGPVGDADSLQSWSLRLVSAGGMQAGPRAACAMPYDMLSLQDSLEGMAGLMQRVQARQRGG